MGYGMKNYEHSWHKFKEDFLIKNELLAKKYQKSSGIRMRNNGTMANVNDKIKDQVPLLQFDKIKKHKDKYTKNYNIAVKNVECRWKQKFIKTFNYYHY